MNKPFNIPIVNHSLKYNPTLDGIRGIAILSVLVFHLYPGIFRYGYLGVDLFFVLSGYLITRIIYTKLEKKSFFFKEFYRNRIRRIFPAVIIVLLFTLIIGYLFLFPSELKNLGHHIKSSAFFYQNFRLINEVGYWDKAAQLKPLLHFWSLSIEEQFYIFWPLLIFIIYKLRLNLIVSLIVLNITLFSLRYFLDIDLFYHSLARFWELSFGGLLFAIAYKYNYEIPRNSFFSNKILVFFGLISFPLYLWHYVIISYFHIFGLNVAKYSFLIIIVSIFLSYIVYRYIEIYARKQTSYIFASILFIMLLIVGLIGDYIYKHNGLLNRSFLVDNKKFEKQFIREKAKNKKGVILVEKILGYSSNNDYIKSTSSDLNKSYIVIVGDSHAHTSYPGFAKLAKKHGYEALLLANSSCPPYIGGAMGKNLKDLKQCKRKINNIYKILNSDLNIKKIIFVTRATVYLKGLGYKTVDGSPKGAIPYKNRSKLETYFTSKRNWNQEKEFLDIIENEFKVYNKSNKRFYYLLENPELGFDPKNCMERPFNIFPTTCKIKLKDFLNRQKEYRSFINKISKKYPNIIVLDPKNLYCDNNYCYAIKNGKMLYADDDHHSINGSIMQAKFFEKKVFNEQ